MRGIFRPLQRFYRTQAGAVAVEFALMVPLLLFIYMAMSELCLGFMAKRRVGHMASAVGDLVTQANTVSSADTADILKITSIIIDPFPTTGAILKARMTHATLNANLVGVVDWSDASTTWTPVAKGSSIAVPNGCAQAGQSVVISEVQYTYSSPVVVYFTTPFVMTEQTCLRPRSGAAIQHQ